MLLLCALPGAAHAAYQCFVSVSSVGVIYTSGNVDTTGTATINCTRAASDANTLSYRLKADNGLNYSGTTRRVRLGATSSRLRYSLRRATTAGSGATCGNSSNWAAPATGTTNVITGVLSFGAALTASATWNYCVRVRAGTGGNPSNPAAGVYSDVVGVTGQFPDSNVGALTAPAPLSYKVGVPTACVFNSFPKDMALAYQSFQSTAQMASQTFSLRCSSGTPWSIAVSPASASALGLNYTVGLSPAAGTGNGNTGTTVTATVTMPGGQSGTCAAGVCTATVPHTVTITY